MKQKTKDYEMFKFRIDNREEIKKKDVDKLVKSIKEHNLLENNPILVNEDMEIMDGQHRLLAAQRLGLEIYYEQVNGLTPRDIILMNIQKNWGAGDYLHYYCTNGYKDYILLKAFIKKHELPLRAGMTIALGAASYSYVDFKAGKFIFKQETLDKELDICWETIDYIKKMNGFSVYTSSTKFWKALLKLITHHRFDPGRWKKNLGKMVGKFTAKASCEDYCKLMMEVFNWKNQQRVNILDEDIS